MNEKVSQSLKKLFEKHRIIFWYDAKKELRNEFEDICLPDVEKIEIKNNEFGLKYKILREKPETKFLIYKEGAAPADIENWLLDVQLANFEFRADQTALILFELGLGNEFTELVNAHIQFFQSAKRLAALKESLAENDTEDAIRLKMTAVCAACPGASIDDILFSFLAESAEDGGDKIALIKKCGLDDFLWNTLKKLFGYNSDAPGIKDFIIELFKSCFAYETGAKHSLNNEAFVFFKRWKDGRSNKTAFEKLSDECAAVLNIDNELHSKDFRTLTAVDFFRAADQKIIGELINAAAEKTYSASEISGWIRSRQTSFWHDYYGKIYAAIDYAVKFMSALEESGLNMGSLQDGVQRYSTMWFKIDQNYRKFMYNVRSSGEISILEPLIERVENLYTNNFLLKVNDYWQSFVDKAGSWNFSGVTMQRDFFNVHVKPFIDRDNKIFVIISDALRYEIGEELLGLIRKEDRFDASLEPMITMLPSYTQLGMAALLPNHEIRIADDDSGTVFVDSQNSIGSENRSKILSQAVNGGGCALKAEEFLNMNRDECRAVVRDNSVIYIYHNAIDAIGDKIASEDKVFVSAQETLDELIRIVKKLTNANASNIIVTADHGFIYQNSAVNENDFSLSVPEGEKIQYRDRRFILGKNLDPGSGFKKFSAAEMGLSGEMEVMLPKSINRLRLRGSGSKYVHGGAALQEIIVPVVKINKKRQSDVSTVEIEIIRSANSIITSGQLSVIFYQTQPVTDKVRVRTLRAGIYNQSNELISDSHELIFDFTSDNPREREKTAQFILTRKADASNNREVILKLEENVHGTAQYSEYKSARYSIRRAIASDFDF